MNQITEIIKNWDIPSVIQINMINNSYKLLCKNNQSFFLKEKKRIEQIESEESLLSYINDHGVPVSVPFRTKKGKCYAEHDSKFYALYKFIKGNHLRCNTFDEYKEAAAIYGTILGKLHRMLKSYNTTHEFIKKMDLSNQIFEWALPTIEGQNKYRKIVETAVLFKEEMRNVFKSLPLQYIHRDFHEDNIMFDGKKFIGLIDFDICMIGYKSYDICYIMTSILMNGIYDDAFKKNWLTLLSVFIESYLKVNELSDAECKGLWHVFIASQLTFIAYFIKHPHEKLLKENTEGFFFIYENRSNIEEIMKSI